jgi:hypothetical protein
VRLRKCPLCHSKAVSALERFVPEEGREHVKVRCGECWTWRAGPCGWRAADTLERRLRRDRERMALIAGQAERWREHELQRLMQMAPRPPRGDHRKTHR